MRQALIAALPLRTWSNSSACTGRFRSWTTNSQLHTRKRYANRSTEELFKPSSAHGFPGDRKTAEALKRNILQSIAVARGWFDSIVRGLPAFALAPAIGRGKGRSILSNLDCLGASHDFGPVHL